MAVIAKRQGKKLFLEIDNGDLEKMERVLKLWNFKDEQAFLRFTVSILIETEEKALWIKTGGNPVPILPADHLIKGQNVEKAV